MMETTISASGLDTFSNVDLALQNDGSFVVSWEGQHRGPLTQTISGQTFTTSNAILSVGAYVQRFDASGQPLAPPDLLASEAGQSFDLTERGVSAAASSSGTLVAYLSASSSTASPQQIVVKASAELFTTGQDKVNFNALTPEQTLAVRSLSSVSALYNALAGDDVITLPDDVHAEDIGRVTGVPISFVLNNSSFVFHGGAGADTFDFTKSKGLNGYAAGETLYINGDVPATDASTTAPYSTPALDDTLNLPGAPGDYRFAVQYGGTLAATHTVVSRNTVTSAGPATPVNIDAANIERVAFEAPISNTVTLYTPDKRVSGSLYGEAAKLSGEVYGPNDVFHSADALASTRVRPGENVFVGSQAVVRGWHEVSAMETGLPPADFGNFPGLSYSFANGLYQGQSLSLPGGQEDALVLSGLVNGKRTLMIAIRGTDEAADLLDYGSFLNSAFPKLAPLFGAVQAYAQDAKNGIERVVVTGHNLGASLAQLFAGKLALSAPVDVFTFGSPGAETLGASSASNQMNFVHTDDPVATILSVAAQITAAKVDAVEKAVFGVVASFLPSLLSVKSRSGNDAFLNSDASSSKLSLEEHRMSGYQADLNKLIAYANDPASSFQSNSFAGALRKGEIYRSAAPQIATGNGTSSGSILNVDVADEYVLGDLNADDTIVWNGAYSKLKDIDGGGGTGPLAFGFKGGDVLSLTLGVWKSH